MEGKVAGLQALVRPIQKQQAPKSLDSESSIITGWKREARGRSPPALLDSHAPHFERKPRYQKVMKLFIIIEYWSFRRSARRK